MRHLLMDPRFPDIVGEWASRLCGLGDTAANDNGGDSDNDEFAEGFLLELARRDVEATRVW